MRADAVRNRGRIIEAARLLMSTGGFDVGMDDIAQRAGIAVGTVYRHFPTKVDLVAAVVDELIERIADEVDAAVEAVGAGGAPAVVLADLFRSAAERQSGDRALKAAARSLGVSVPEAHLPSPSAAVSRAQEGLDTLLRAARTAGVLAEPTSLTDLVVLLDGVPDAALGAARRERYVRLVLRGLLAPSPTSDSAAAALAATTSSSDGTGPLGP